MSGLIVSLAAINANDGALLNLSEADPIAWHAIPPKRKRTMDLWSFNVRIAVLSFDRSERRVIRCRWLLLQ
jgi:hypothetical protein